MTSNPPPWGAVRALFEQVLALPGAQREAVLAAAAQANAALAAEVRSLLAHHESDTGGRLSEGALASAATVPAAAPPQAQRADAAEQRIGQQLGPWRITSLLGRGGMGEVWLAERADGAYQGHAAVKVLKRGMDSAAVLGRFALEQQALARLAHPHIARLLDAGRTAEGLPYFVMEHVRGRPIDQACAGRPLAERLQLFLQLTEAVAHAHRNLLVHRDLKPGNVMVDEDGRVRLLDFGIAKALDPLEGGALFGADSTLTAAGERPFTPHYASPEQVRGEPVSTATDVYSLGALLYVLLTGQRPYGRRATSAAEVARCVLKEEPTRPSQLAPPAGSSERVQRELRGDLDNIVLKALEKQVPRRYAGVDALAADVRAFLEGRPVSARSASAGYVLAKFLLRNRMAVLAAALGALGLGTGLVATVLQGRAVLALGAVGLGAGLVLALVQARRAQLARDEAARARDGAQRHLAEMRRLANAMVFEVNDALEAGPTEGRRQLVRAAAQSLERQAGFGQLSARERLELAHSLNRLARIEGHEFTNNLGNPQGALAHYERALQLLEPLQAQRLPHDAGGEQGGEQGGQPDSEPGSEPTGEPGSEPGGDLSREPATQAERAEWHGAMYTALEGRAAVQRWQRRYAEALASMQRAAHHAERAAALAPTDWRWRANECFAHIELSGHCYKAARNTGLTLLAEARVHAAKALHSSAAFVADAPREMPAWRLRATVLRMHAGLLIIEGRLAEAGAVEHEAFAALEHACGLPGGELVRLHDYVVGLIHVSLTSQTRGANGPAEAAALRAVAHAEQAHREDPLNEWTRRQVFASLQVTLDLYLRSAGADGAADEAHETDGPAPPGRRHSAAQAAREAPGSPARTERASLGAALHERLMAQIGPPPPDGGPAGTFWNRAWADALYAMCLARSGRVDEADATVQELRRWLRCGNLALHDPAATVGAHDAELDAHIHTAWAYVEAARGHASAAAQAAETALAKIERMLTARDPTDAMEQLIAVQDLVRLAQAPFDQCGSDASVRALRARIVDRARALDEALMARGVLAPGQRAESRWLGSGPPA